MDVRPKTFTLMTKVCNFPYAIYDLTKTFDTLFFLLRLEPECKNHTLFLTKMAKIDAPFMTKTAAKLVLSHL